MFPLNGLYAVLAIFLPEQLATQVSIAIPMVVFFLWLWAVMTREENEDVPVSLPEPQLLSITPFFRSRFDFLRRGFALTGQSVYKFNLLRNTVVVLSGESARREFFQAAGLDLTAGFKVLSGAIPMMPGVTSDITARRVSTIHKRLSAAQNSERLSKLLPKILDDSRKAMEQWGNAGILDPFEQISHLIFQTTVRCLATEDLADNEADVARLGELYDRLDMDTTPASVLFPWFPSPSAVRRLLTTKTIFDIVSAVVDARISSGVVHDDTIQMLLDCGDDRMIIIGFILGLLVAGARSTGTTATWLFTFLGGHPQWKAKAAVEAAELLQLYAPHPLEHRETSAPTAAPTSTLSSLSQRLACVPLEAWEGATPVMDALLRETLRLAQPHAAMRMNTGPDIQLGGKNIPTGTFVMYPFSDVHLSPELYPEPWKFDPGRPQSKMPFSYVGWGGGKSVCLGQRLARLELKLVMALFMLGFDAVAVDANGRSLSALPRPNWNDSLTCKPPKGSCYLRYERTGL
ncbi:cytochrome P450 [Obba rivulosa]|uniref:Cytochrome P450 n=1 Tax=Obba rivulosa TaxID=1052685 RepID=A0A8E2AUA0_9APHY|nr:cytochrome P450 [Obba rivulosa]